MAAASKSPSLSSPIQANSPRSRHSQRSSAARGVPSPPPLSLSGTVDQDQSVTSLSTTSSDTCPPNEASKLVAQDGSDAGADAQLGDSGNVVAAKKPAWSMPSNRVAAEAGVLIGSEFWPALSEIARASHKNSTACSLKALSNRSIIISEGMAAGPLSLEKAADTGILTPNSSLNHVNPTVVGDSSNHSSMPFDGSLSQSPQVLSAFAEPPSQNARNSGGSFGVSNWNKTHRDAGQRGRSFGGDEQQQQHGSLRSNNGPQARGDHHRHAGRRDSHQSFGGRESTPSQKRDGSRPLIRGSAPNAPFRHPSPLHVPMRHYMTPMVYNDVPPHVYYVPSPYPDAGRPMHMVPYSSMLFPMPDPHLRSKILNQIDYYFSNENLVKDTFLRQKMDAEGWVSIKLIAGFKKVMQLTDNIHLMLDALQASNVVEVQGEKVRRKTDWIKWIMPSSQYHAVTSRSSHESSLDIVAAHLHSVTLG